MINQNDLSPAARATFAHLQEIFGACRNQSILEAITTPTHAGSRGAGSAPLATSAQTDKQPKTPIVFSAEMVIGFSGNTGKQDPFNQEPFFASVLRKAGEVAAATGASIEDNYQGGGRYTADLLIQSRDFSKTQNALLLLEDWIEKIPYFHIRKA